MLHTYVLDAFFLCYILVAGREACQHREGKGLPFFIAVVMFVCMCVRVCWGGVDKGEAIFNTSDKLCASGSVTPTLQIQLEDRIKTLQELIVNSNIGPPQQRQFRVRQ